MATKSLALSMPSAKTASESPKYPARSFMTIRTALTQKPMVITRSAIPKRSFLSMDFPVIPSRLMKKSISQEPLCRLLFSK